MNEDASPISTLSLFAASRLQWHTPTVVNVSHPASGQGTKSYPKALGHCRRRAYIAISSADFSGADGWETAGALAPPNGKEQWPKIAPAAGPRTAFCRACHARISRF